MQRFDIDLEKYSPEEQEHILAIMGEISQHGWSQTLKDIEQLDWQHPLPSVRELLLDDYYFGQVGKNLYPMLQDDLCEILENPFLEVIETGAIGWGKSFMSGIGIAIDMLRLACLYNPQTLLGSASGTKMVFMNLSVNASQAANVLGRYITATIKSSPFVAEVLRPKVVDGHYISFPCSSCYGEGRSKFGGTCGICNGTGSKHIQYMAGNSSELAVIGENLIGGGMDEANFMVSVRRTRRSIMAGEFDQAKTLYDAVVRRRESRFIAGMSAELAVMPRFWTISSVQFPGEFTEQRILKAKNNPRIKVLEYSTWEPRRSLPVHPYSGKEFVVLIGDAMNNSRIVADDADEFDESLFQLPVGCKLVRVPVEHRQPFDDDVLGGIRDVIGHSVLAKNPYFTHPLDPCINNLKCGDLPGREHPYEFVEAKLVSGSLLHAELIPTQSARTRAGIEPAINPGAPRFAHVDLALTGTTAGITIGHFGGYKRYTRQVFGQKQIWNIVEDRPITIVDFFLRVVPPDAGRIDIDAILGIFYTFQHACGAHFGKISYDRFESATSINVLQSQGIEAENLSIMRHQEAWTYLRDSIRDQRFSCYSYAPFVQELAAVEWDTKTQKVTKKEVVLPSGIKHHCDVAESTAGVCYHINERYGIRRPALPAATWSQMEADVGDQVMENLFKKSVGEGYISEDIAKTRLQQMEDVARSGGGDPWGDLA